MASTAESLTQFSNPDVTIQTLEDQLPERLQEGKVQGIRIITEAAELFFTPGCGDDLLGLFQEAQQNDIFNDIFFGLYTIINSTTGKESKERRNHLKKLESITQDLLSIDSPR